jgi:hypothetical protein
MDDEQQTQPENSQVPGQASSWQIENNATEEQIVSFAVSQPAGMVNGQPYQQSPVTEKQLKDAYAKKPSKWLYFYIFLALVQVLGVGYFFRSLLDTIGKPGSEFFVIVFHLTVVPATGFVAFVNLVGLSIYIIDQKPRGKGLIWGVLSLILSTLILMYILRIYLMFFV